MIFNLPHLSRKDVDIKSSNLDFGWRSLASCTLVDVPKEVALRMLPMMFAQDASPEPLCGVPKNITPLKQSARATYLLFSVALLKALALLSFKIPYYFGATHLFEDEAPK